MDCDGPVTVRTPLALSRLGPRGRFPPRGSSEDLSFTCNMGTPQGDVSSPAAWLAVMDILLRALEHTPNHPYTLRGSGDTIYSAPEVSFADDLTTFSSDCRGLQAQAHTVSAFTGFFGLTIATHKLRLVVFGGSSPPLPETVVVHTASWRPVPLSLQYSGVVRILGYHFSLDGSHAYQRTLTKQRITVACGAMHHATRSSPAGVALSAMVSCMARASYVGQFSPWTLKELQALEVPLNNLFRRLLKMMPTCATNLLYMTTPYGGAGLPCLSDNVIRRKWKIVHRSLHPSHGGPTRPRG